MDPQTNPETEQTETQDQADQEAAFAASFEGKEPPTAAKPQEKPTPEEGATEAAAAAATKETTAQAADPKAASTTPDAGAEPAKPATTPEAASTTPTPKADDSADLRAALRRLEGRYGALNDELTKLKTTKEAEGKPAVATSVELARLKAEYPEVADALVEDLTKAIGGLAGKGPDPKEIETLVTQRVAAETARLRDAVVDDAHPTWRADLFTQDAAGQKVPSADYLAWKTSIGADEARAFEESTNPYQVVRKLTAFYEWKAKAKEGEDAKQKRLKAAVQPTGAHRAAPTTLSDDEAERKGFEEGFNS